MRNWFIYTNVCIFFLLIVPAYAQKPVSATCSNCNGYSYCVLNDFLIVASAKTYNEAKKTALNCAVKLNIPYRSRGAISDTTNGSLTYPPDTCMRLVGYVSCSPIRGLRGVNPCETDNGIYITIEPTGNYVNLRAGYYAVVIGSGYPGDRNLKSWLAKAKTAYPGSYIKRTILLADGGE